MDFVSAEKLEIGGVWDFSVKFHEWAFGIEKHIKTVGKVTIPI